MTRLPSMSLAPSDLVVRTPAAPGPAAVADARPLGTQRPREPEGVKPVASRYCGWKAAAEALLAAALLAVATPIILVFAALIRLSSRGPAIYHQTRLGKNGRPFTIYKLRTMTADAENETGPVWAQKADPRITSVGRLLRATHLDELPQLVNVILGQMSLIGPRPERPEIVESLQHKIDGYGDRLLVRPGITGLAQIHLPPDVSLDAVRRKLVCDLYYVRHLSAWLDVRILICTSLLWLGVPTHFSRRILRIPNPLVERN